MPMFDRVEQDEIRRLVRAIFDRHTHRPESIIGFPFDFIDGGFAYAAGVDGLDGGTSASNSTGYSIDGGTA